MSRDTEVSACYSRISKSPLLSPTSMFTSNILKVSCDPQEPIWVSCMITLVPKPGLGQLKGQNSTCDLPINMTKPVLCPNGVT
eukprot:scaffold138115_cov18-Tisochrysis_lutea.AAC.1